jgi:hypothetical protein
MDALPVLYIAGGHIHKKAASAR